MSASMGGLPKIAQSRLAQISVLVVEHVVMMPLVAVTQDLMAKIVLSLCVRIIVQVLVSVTTVFAFARPVPTI